MESRSVVGPPTSSAARRSMSGVTSSRARSRPAYQAPTSAQLRNVVSVMACAAHRAFFPDKPLDNNTITGYQPWAKVTTKLSAKHDLALVYQADRLDRKSTRLNSS